MIALTTGAITNPLRLLTGFKDHVTILWDAGTGKPRKAFKGHNHLVLSVVLSGDGKRVLTGSGDKTAILWDSESGKPLQSFKGHTNPVTSVALSGDGKRVFTGSKDKTAILWDAQTGKPLQAYKGHTGPVTSVAMGRDGKRVLTGSADMTAILWDTGTAKPLQTFKGHVYGLCSVALSGDGKRVLTGSSDDTAMLWDADTGKPLQTFKGHANSVISVALSGDGKRVLTGSQDKTAILWDSESGKSLQTFKGHNGFITSVAFAPRNDFVVTASLDGTVRIWKPGRADPVFSFLSAGEDWIFWTPEGYYTCSPNGESLIAWKIKDDSPQGYRIVGPEQFHKQFYRPDLFRHLLAELDLGKALALADKDRGRRPTRPSTFAEALPPSVMIAKPLRSGEIIKTEECEIAAKAISVGDNYVASLQLLVDGRPYDGGRRKFTVRKPRAGEATATWKVHLPVGKRHIQVVAEGIKGSTQSSQSVEIICEEQREAPPPCCS